MKPQLTKSFHFFVISLFRVFPESPFGGINQTESDFCQNGHFGEVPEFGVIQSHFRTTPECHIFLLFRVSPDSCVCELSTGRGTIEVEIVISGGRQR